MKKSALLSSPGSDVKTRLERARSCGSTSHVRSRPALSSAIRAESMSKPITRVAAAPEGPGDPQPHISETDDGKLATVRHDFGFDAIPLRSEPSYPALGAIRNG